MTRQESSPYVEVTTSHKAFSLKRKPLLSMLDIELTERCNSNCIHCCINLPAGDQEARSRELSTDDIKRILTEAVSLDCMRVRFTGGEPLLRPDFEELYLFARRLGLKVLLFTNATLLTERLADLFARIPPLEKIEISVYGMRRESYEAVTRVPGTFEAAFRGIELLRQKQVPFTVKSAFLPMNKMDVETFEQWASRIPGLDHPPMYSMFFDLSARRDAARNQEIMACRAKPEEGLAIIARNRKAYFDEMKQFCSKFMRSSGDLLFSCGAGCGGCVDAYGNFQLCMMFRHPDYVYNLRQGTLKEAMTDFFPQWRNLKAVNSDYLARCAKCFLKGLCEQCPAKSWSEHGTLDKPVEYLCRIAHVQAEDLGLLKKGEKAWEVMDGWERVQSMGDF